MSSITNLILKRVNFVVNLFRNAIIKQKGDVNQLERLEAGLATARALIREATILNQTTSTLEDADYVPNGDIYRNAYAFHRYVVLNSCQN